MWPRATTARGSAPTSSRTRRSSGPSSDAGRPVLALPPAARRAGAETRGGASCTRRSRRARSRRRNPRRPRTSTPSSPARRSSCSPSATRLEQRLVDGRRREPGGLPARPQAGHVLAIPTETARPVARTGGRSDAAGTTPQQKSSSTAGPSTRSSGRSRSRTTTGWSTRRRSRSRTLTGRAPISSPLSKTLTVELGWDDEHAVLFEGLVARTEAQAQAGGQRRTTISAYDMSYQMQRSAPRTRDLPAGALSAIIRQMSARLPAGDRPNQAR